MQKLLYIDCAATGGVVLDANGSVVEVSMLKVSLLGATAEDIDNQSSDHF